MTRSRVVWMMLATVALAAGLAGAGAGRAAGRALSRAVDDAGQSVHAIHADAQLPSPPADPNDLPAE